MKAMVTPIMDAAAANLPSSEAKLRKEVLYDILDETMKLVPPMLDAMTGGLVATSHFLAVGQCRQVGRGDVG